MPYYLKITYRGKMKKFIVHHPKHISLAQIKSSFVPPIPPYHALRYSVEAPACPPRTLEGDAQLLEYLLAGEFAERAAVRITVEEILLPAEEEDSETELEK